MEQIEQWLLNQNYEQGKLLYKQYIGEDYTFELLSIGENSFTSKKLHESLSKFLSENISIQKEIPSEILESKELAQQLMNERSELKALLRFQFENKIDNKEKRTAAVQRILSIRNELNRIYGNIQLYDQQGIIVSVDSNEDPEDPSNKRYLNLRTYITKYETCLKESKTLAGCDMSQKQRESYQSKLTAFIAEKNDLETKFANAILIE